MYIAVNMTYNAIRLNAIEERNKMTIEIRDTAIENIVNGLKIIEQNMEYWSKLAEDARRNDVANFIVRGYEQKAEIYKHEQFGAQQVICDLGGGEFYNFIMDQVRAKKEAN